MRLCPSSLISSKHECLFEVFVLGTGIKASDSSIGMIVIVMKVETGNFYYYDEINIKFSISAINFWAIF